MLGASGLHDGRIKILEMMFATENSNDKGERLTLETAELIVKEFKFYMYKCKEVLGNSPKGKEKGVMLPFPPPPLIGKVHDLFLRFPQDHALFCKNLFGYVVYRNRDFS